MKSDLKALLVIDENSLLSDLAKQMGRGFGPGDLLRAGREIFDNCWSQVEHRVCGSEKVAALHKASESDQVEVSAAVLDCIIGVLHGVPAATVAVLIVKRGLSNLCRVRWARVDDARRDS